MPGRKNETHAGTSHNTASPKLCFTPCSITSGVWPKPFGEIIAQPKDKEMRAQEKNKIMKHLILLVCFSILSCSYSIPMVKEHPSALPGKWTTISVQDPKKEGPEFGWDLTFTPAGQCTIKTDGGFRIYTEMTGNYHTSGKSLIFEFNGREKAWECKYDASDSILTIIAPEILGWKLNLVKTKTSNPKIDSLPRIPKTIENAVRLLYSELSEADFQFFLSATDEDLIMLHHGYGMYIRNRFRLWGGNKDLLFACDPIEKHPDNASGVIINNLWKRVREYSDSSLVRNIDLQNSFLINDSIKASIINGKRMKIIIDSLNYHLATGKKTGKINTTFIIVEDSTALQDSILSIPNPESRFINLNLALSFLNDQFDLFQVRSIDGITLKRRQRQE
jgi:hypothetical protein